MRWATGKTVKTNQMEEKHSRENTLAKDKHQCSNKNIPSEMEVAPRYLLLTLLYIFFYIVYTIYTVFIDFTHNTVHPVCTAYTAFLLYQAVL